MVMAALLFCTQRVGVRFSTGPPIYEIMIDALLDFYVCPNHCRTGGYESCCACGGWEESDEDEGRECTEANSNNTED